MINPIVANQTAPKTTKTSIFYVNDLHAQSMKMEKIYNASKSFDQFVPSSKTDKLKLCAGDSMLGESKKPNIIASKFLDLIGVTATAVGNHECDMDSKDLHELTKDKNFKMLGLNVKIKDSNHLSKTIQKSYIVKKNSTK